ncbi:MAG: DNA translocase FtsK [Schleiferiaceae bacterium]|nr:DNA translocase FtsK [Schleiferiaceae bacterium]
MAKKSTKKTPKEPSKFSVQFKQLTADTKEITGDPTTKIFGSLLLVMIGFFTAIAIISFYQNWTQDFSLSTTSSGEYAHPDYVGNIFGRLGNAIASLLVLEGFGLAGLFVPLWIMLLGLKHAFTLNRIKPWVLFNHLLATTFLVALMFGWIANHQPTLLSGLSGYYIYLKLALYLGRMGVLLVLFTTGLLYIVVALKIRSLTFSWRAPKQLQETEHPSEENLNSSSEITPEPQDDILVHAVELSPEPEEEMTPQPEVISRPTVTDSSAQNKRPIDAASTLDVVVEVHQEAVEDEKSINKKVKDFGEYDPTLDLSRFQLPKIELLQPYGDGKITFDKDEIEANKNRIVDTLKNYSIEIKEIKATIGPTVTLYEIVPAAGIRISKIKNLEDDIALSLAALGIRIIAPIPGKGTIGIEVPNANPQVVSMRQVIASKKFQESNMELPVAMGRTITNENFIFDLAKMPHLLMAGATGQGKSVGLNAILTSLLYKKHPSQLKFVLVDPKKVELTLYNKIERHYLAVLPDTDEAIITDTAKVIHTLNSLCIEMDNRYELLKGAMVRNIKEYNAKFISRRLNPEEGHKFLPYIVLVIDEFADLIMTAGKEVEMPIARLAQLARAIGIHLIVATQRPSVNVITGIIKANFPARAAFRVTSKIDSRTILDAGGADQLIGKGDMLFSQGSDLVRLQCAFVDTPEVEAICDFIGNQQAYPMAYQLPEYVGEESGGVGDIDPSDRDSLFEDAARLVVLTQQGSTSMIQRKLKLGYNRAGRIVDQLEAAGILGPFEGSKARQVLIPDEIALEQKLNGDA